MKTSEELFELFPAEKDIPDEFRLTSPIRQRTYLVNRELRIWNGNYHTVLSPVWLKSARSWRA